MPTTLKASWPQIRESIRKRIGELWYNSWLKDAHLIALDANTIELGVPGHFFVEWIQEKYSAKILDAVEEVTGLRPALKLSISGFLFRKMREQQHEVLEEVRSASKTAVKKPVKRAKTGRRQIFALQDKFSLDEFVAGDTNRFVYGIARQIVENPTDDKRNPFFLYGPSGVGKTHLLQGIALELLRRHPDLSVLYVPCEYFLNQFVLSLKANDTDTFRKQFRNVDVLMIDDVHQLANKKATQTEFLHTFNHLIDKGRQLILASAVAPRALERISEHLVNRFEAGLVAKLEAPNRETRKAILKRRLAGHDRLTRPEIVELLADKLNGDVRELEGTLNKLVIVSSLLPGPVTKEVISEALEELSGFDSRTIMLSEVEDEVVKLLGVSSDDIHSNSRRRDIASARQMCMYLARNLTDYSLNEIGRYFGGKNHATVVFSEKKVRQRIDEDAVVREQVETLTRILKRNG